MKQSSEKSEKPKRKYTRKKKETPVSTVSIPLKNTLIQLASDWGLDYNQLIAYAEEDTIPGNDEGNRFGASNTVDARIVYALIRQYKPERVLEIGTHHGGSANHIAMALLKNGNGKLITVDINANAGHHIDKKHQAVTQFINMNIDFYLPTITNPFDFIFDDGAHSEGQVHNIYQALPRILNSGGVILSHDVGMEGIGDYIRNGIEKGGVPLDQVKIYITKPSPCGLTMWRKQ